MQLNDALAAVPPISGKRIATRIRPSALRHVRRGHPWIFDDSVLSLSFDGSAGDLAVVFDDDRKFAAIGLYDPHSVIPIRVLHQGKPLTIDETFWRQKVGEAADRRAILATSSGVDGYRLVHGENDGLPGLILDRYADTLVVKVYTASWLPHLSALLSSVDMASAGFDPTTVVLRTARQVQRAETFGLGDGTVLAGSDPDPVRFVENGLVFEADTRSGQKTGHFLDQRDNRKLVRDNSQGKRVLDVFSCTGGFSVHAAAGGAPSVVSVDQSRHALTAAKRNMALNSAFIGSTDHDTMQGDAFKIMENLARAGRRFDLIIVDPPSFAQKQSDHDLALRAYGRLTNLAIDLLDRGGTLVQASCSSRVTQQEFTDVVERAVDGAGRRVSSLEVTGHAVDHPVGFSEGAYLKAVRATFD